MTSASVVPKFGNRRFDVQAAQLSRLHHRFADYISQAPVIVPASMGLGIEGRRLHELFLVEMCERGVKLRQMMAVWGLAYPLRKIRARTLIEAGASFYRAFWSCNPSRLAQALEANKRQKQQRELLHDLRVWRNITRTRPNWPGMNWALGIFGEDFPVDVSHLKDFFLRGEFDPRWGRYELARAIQRWEQTYTQRERLIDQLKDKGVDPNEDVDPAPFPRRYSHDDLTLHALTTPVDLVEDGARMRHCVGDYFSALQTGRVRLYSVREGEVRIATAEVELREESYRLKQIKARCNRQAPKRAVTAVKALMTDVAEGAQ